MSIPLLSVCLITYKHELYIRQAIESILMQKIDFSWEIIIADDCSPDGTAQIVQEYQMQYPELIRLIKRESNVGPGENFVELLGSAKGKYIAYLEGDDYWTDDKKLQKQFALMESTPEYSMCYHKIKWDFDYPSDNWEKLGSESNVGDQFESNISDVLKRGWFIRSSSMFFRNIKLPPNFEKLNTGDFPLHVLMAHTGKIRFINEVMGVYRIHQQGISERVLITDNVEKRTLNCRQNIEMYDYINKHTGHSYNAQLKHLIFNAIYSHCRFLKTKNTSAFLAEIIYGVKKMGFFFVTWNLAKKIKFLFKAKKQASHAATFG